MFFPIFRFGGHFVQWNNFNNFGRGSPKAYFCEIILKSGHCSRRRCRLKKFLTDGRQTNIVDDGQISITIAHHEMVMLR